MKPNIYAALGCQAFITGTIYGYLTIGAISVVTIVMNRMGKKLL
ncbi:MAG: hypothetical protein ACFFDV_05940 [Candidatus Thorarchaeota archaeon]